MFEARNFRVFVNDRALICDSASVIEQNSTAPISLLNKKNASYQVANGPVTSKISLNYTLSLDFSGDALLNSALFHQTGDINALPIPVVLKVGLFSGSYLIDSYNLGFSPNGQVKPSCSLTSYYATSGTMAENTQAIVNHLSGDFTSNTFNAQFLNFNGTAVDLNIYDLGYSVSFDYLPIYVLGRKDPQQIILNGINESLNATHDAFSHIEYSGQTGYINNLGSLKIHSVSKEINPFDPLTPYFSRQIGLSGFTTKSTEISPIDNVILNKTSFERAF